MLSCNQFNSAPLAAGRTAPTRAATSLRGLDFPVATSSIERQKANQDAQKFQNTGETSLLYGLHIYDTALPLCRGSTFTLETSWELFLISTPLLGTFAIWDTRVFCSRQPTANNSLLNVQQDKPATYH
jgi:hypothetical protein